MIRVMVVEDDALYRKKIVSMLDWESIGFEVCGTAVHGKDALAQLDTLNPEVILTDISMPQMDGIELIRRVRQLRPQVRFVVLSSYDDFYLVKDAMKLGVDDYILKQELDSKMDQLLQILREVQALLPASGQKRPLLEDNRLVVDIFLSKLVAEPIRDAALAEERLRRLLVFFPFDKYQLLLLRPQQPHAAAEAEDARFRQALLGLEGEAAQYLPFFPIDEAGAVLINLKGVFSASRQRSLATGAVHATTQRLGGMQLRAGLSGAYQGIAALPEAFAQAKQALLETGLVSAPTFAAAPTAPEEDAPWTEPILAAYLEALQRRDEAELKALLGRCLQGGRWEHTSVRQARRLLARMQAGLDALAKRLGLEATQQGAKPAPVWGLADVEQAMNGLLEQARGILALEVPDVDTQNPTVQKMLRFLAANFRRDITLTDLAREVNLSENYTSNLFKQETGHRVTSYLNELRIRQAWHMLQAGDAKVYEIAQQCGFPNASYFSKIFKEKSGLSITEYRKKILDNTTHSKEEPL